MSIPSIQVKADRNPENSGHYWEDFELIKPIPDFSDLAGLIRKP